jgi:hypothetical protein
MEKEQKNNGIIGDPGITKCAEGEILHSLKMAHESRDIKTLDSILKKLEELRVDF